MGLFKWLAVLAVLTSTCRVSLAKTDPPASTTTKVPTETAASSAPAQNQSQPQPPASTGNPAATTTQGPGSPPATARQYLEAAAKLHNKGRYELADRYLKAAPRYKDRLTLNEQIVLGVYRERIDKELRRLKTPLTVPEPPPYARFSSDKTDPSVKAAGTESSSNLPESATAGLDSDSASLNESNNPLEASTNSGMSRIDPKGIDPLQKLYGSQTSRNGDDTKQRGRWLLQLAREQVYRGNYEKAKELVGQVQQMNITWGYFDDSPEKVIESLAKVEETKRNGTTEATTKGSFDRRTAKARLREARAAMVLGDFDRAESIADEVRSWRIGFYFFDDTPEKIYSAIDSARRRRGPRSSRPNSDQSSSDSPLSSLPSLEPDLPSNNRDSNVFDLGHKNNDFSGLPR